MNFVFDIESSGLPNKRNAPHSDLEAYGTARIVSICWLLAQGEKITEQSYFIIKPEGFTISDDAFRIHGISQEQADTTGVPIAQVFKELKESLEHAHSIISYNIDFDINVLKSELFRAGQTDLIEIVDKKHHICCMKKAKEFLRMERWPKLSHTYEHIFNEPLKNAHNAMADTMACFKVYNHMFPLSKDVFFIRNRKVELTPEQSEIVFAPLHVNIAVLAAAGSGKSTVITARVKHLVDQGVKEKHIMVTTFTRDASNDMKQKLTDIFGYKPEVTVGTLDTISKVATFYSKHSSKRDVTDVSEHAQDYLEYIRKHPHAIKKYKYMFIDEFQDINQLQFDIIKEFAKNDTIVFVVGDDHQNIYTFRGSSIEYIINFKQLFPTNSEMFKLTFNFRSTREIINFANASISNNLNQIPKKMVPGIPQAVPKPKPQVKYFTNVMYQNSFVINQIKKIIQDGTPLDEIAVLSPLNNSLFLIEEALITNNIKCVYLDGKSDVRTMKKSGHVCLCTIHKSKGLEWEHVFLTNASDDLIPKLKSPKSVEEDRRLFYVAVTRAKLRLFITYTANQLAPFVSRYVSEVSQEFYDFIDYDPKYAGTSQNDIIKQELSVTKLLETLQGEDHVRLKQTGIMPTINIETIPKHQLYTPYSYLPIIEQEQLYSDFGMFMDALISREISRAFTKTYKDKHAVQLLAGIILSKDNYQIYKLYKSHFKNNINNIQNFTPPQIINCLNANCTKSITRDHIPIVVDIVMTIKSSAEKFKLPLDKIPVFTDRFLPDEFSDQIHTSLINSNSDLPLKQVVDDIWEISKCQPILTSFRRRLLYMDIRPTKDMKAYESLFQNATQTFIEFIKSRFNFPQDIGIHEDLCSQDDIFGELDLRIGDTIIDFKNTINDEVSTPWILQLLTYKALYEHQNPQKTINKIGVFNPLRGWYVEFDVSNYDKQDQLLTYLIEKNNKI